ncbi:MAG: hypothetical protein ABIQ62_00250 [Thermomonas sp.]
MSSPRLVLLMSLTALLAAPLVSHAQAAPAIREYRVLLAGNSLIYTNNLPALLRAVGASQGITITTETYAKPGGALAERMKDGHLAEALRNRTFDVVVLQEQGGKLAACMASVQEQRKAPCAASLRAYTETAKLASEHGAKTLVFATWGPDERWQGRLNRSARMIADKASASVFNAAGALSALRTANPAVTLFPDGTHPSTQASLMLALALYRDITGTSPVAKDLRVTAPLLPVAAAVSGDSPMEKQPGLAGDGKVTVVPASLLEPLIRALPAPSSEEVRPSRRGR